MLNWWRTIFVNKVMQLCSFAVKKSCSPAARDDIPRWRG
jgi:hypothetical protein